MSADTNGKTGVREMFLRTIAVIGLLAVLILGAWGIIVLATSIPHLFERAGNDVEDIIDGDDEQTSVVVTPVAPTTPAAPVTPAKPTTPKPTTVTKPSTPSYTYVPASTRAALYGLPDLFVTVQNVSPLPGGRTNVQFSVTNAGSNVASAGWSFNAEFPWDRSTYTYNSPSQQTLYPGDKIVYNLGVETSGYSSNSGDECDTDGYRNWDERDWEDWYDDEDCGDEFDCENIDEDEWDNWDEEDWEEWYEDECDEDEYYDNDRDSRDSDGTITISVDPYNRVYEQNESNNRASVRQ